MNTLVFRKELVLPKKLREELRKVHGRLVQENDLLEMTRGAERIYAVGDMTVETLLKIGVKPDVSIFDYKVGREVSRSRSIARAFLRPITARNRSGTISRELWLAIRHAVDEDKPTGIRVYGEEDMAAVACAYLAHDGSLLLYGLPGRGINIVRITPNVRRHALGILKRMNGA